MSVPNNQSVPSMQSRHLLVSIFSFLNNENNTKENGQKPCNLQNIKAKR